ncbi:MAG: hypothetical protein J0I09_07695 [Sphingobacteriia bacterium]|nr:hypothetical protein [Sphingobacteriia bacterium]
MKKRFLGITCCILFFLQAFAQQDIDTSIRASLHHSSMNKKNIPTVNENLFLLAKVWGFLKYYHPTIAAGKFNWDQELIAILPSICNSSAKERNELLEQWLNKFGPVSACTSCNDSILVNAKLKPDFSWINEKNFSKALVQKLLFIKNNRIQQEPYYIKVLAADGVNFIQFQHEPLYLNLVFPNDTYGLLSLFRFWNIIEYWYPYRYGPLKQWDTFLYEFIPKMLRHTNGYDYTICIEQMLVALQDGHGYCRGPLTEEILGKYYMPFTVKLIEHKLLVTSILKDSLAALSKIKVGDIIESIDNKSIPTLIQQISSNLPASNTGSLLHKMSYRLTRSNNKENNLTVRRNGELINIRTQNYIPNIYPPVNLAPPFFSYQKDSAFCMLEEEIGYVNLGKFKRADSLALKSFISKAKSLIIDNRQNQDETNGTGGGDIVAKLILPAENRFVKFTSAQPKYPGVFTLGNASNMGITESANPFKGNIIILINEKTISVGEFLTMAYQKAPTAKTLGTTTAGADGNIAHIMLPGSINTVVTGLGVYYPNGKKTQRTGIKPDIEVTQTIWGYQQGIDEQLAKAVDYLKRKQ